jgi:hypothetical protein
MRRHGRPLRMTLLAAFGLLCKSELTDSLIDLLLSTVHRIASRAERPVEKEWLNDLKRVAGKNSLLFQVADQRAGGAADVVDDAAVLDEEVAVFTD